MSHWSLTVFQKSASGTKEPSLCPKEDDNVLFKNVRAIRTEGKDVILTNILEQEMRVPSEISVADLINGFVIINEA